MEKSTLNHAVTEQQQGNVHTNRQNGSGKNRDLDDVEFEYLTDGWDFYTKQSLEFSQNGVEKQKKKHLWVETPCWQEKELDS